MSRRRGEFEHRTSIFEGAYRAWSHLGGLSIEHVQNLTPADLDPLTHPLTDDPRVKDTKYIPNSVNDEGFTNPDGSPRRKYPYEPLPRTGLSHPYVQAILSPWLGPDADNEAIQLGLTTLRTWWQHRRKGESGSAIAALGTSKMQGVVEGYTRHFFTLAHCLVVNDGEQAPRTLFTKMKEYEKKMKKVYKKKDKDVGDSAQNGGNQLTPLEQLHKMQQEQSGIMPQALGIGPSTIQPLMDLKAQCQPGKVNLPQVVDAIAEVTNAQNRVHRGALPTVNTTHPENNHFQEDGMTPVVYVSSNGDCLIAMSIDGITCAHCVKIVETVLKGCSGRSPIEGLLDAAADQSLAGIIIKIDSPSNASRIASEAARNLGMVGYTAECKVMPKRNNVELLNAAFVGTSYTGPASIFDWSIPCSCPDIGVMRHDCDRHAQMGDGVFHAFHSRQFEVEEYLRNGPTPTQAAAAVVPRQQAVSAVEPSMTDEPLSIEQDMNLFGMAPPPPGQKRRSGITQRPSDMQSISLAAAAAASESGDEPLSPSQQTENGTNPTFSFRSPSILSYGNGLRGMSMTSETTFGRAMSGLSALAIDWENLEDFDVNVDHSAHINNNQNPNVGRESEVGNDGMMQPYLLQNNGLRSSFRRVGTNDSDAHNVTFRF